MNNRVTDMYINYYYPQIYASADTSSMILY